MRQTSLASEEQLQYTLPLLDGASNAYTHGSGIR